MREFYRQQVGVNPEPGLTVSRRTPMEGALQEAGSTLSGISTDYMRRMARDEAEASVAAEDVRSKRSWLEAHDKMATMSDPKEIHDFYKEWEQNERDTVASIDTNRLGRRAIGFSTEKNLVDKSHAVLGIGGFYDQAQIRKNSEAYLGVIENAKQGIISDRFKTPIEAVQNSANWFVQKKIWTPQQAAKVISEFPKQQSEVNVSTDTYEDPLGVVENIDEQISGKKIHYPGIDNQELKQHRAYAQKIHSERSATAAEELYDLNSEYQKMDDIQKTGRLTELRDSKMISADTWKQEMDNIREPDSIDTSSEHITKFIDFQTEMFDAGGSSAKIAHILSAANEANMPRYLKTELVGLAKDLKDPTSKFNSPNVKYGLNQIDNYFKIYDVAPKPTPFAPIKRFFGAQATPAKYDDDVRKIVELNANYEAKQEWIDWTRSSAGQGASDEDRNKKLSSILIDTHNRYRDYLPAIMESLDLDEEQPPETPIPKKEPTATANPSAGNNTPENVRVWGQP